ncbi:hypothetical protein M422DRAFT_252751 [Sphaerobolus stellatus SS14]|uniref:Uncharacterized protein n=1 Tax=Sphaerobolus stellatus (strain SS14) TaxID=990650 RepID=A0A0C9UKJ5_SPHS4|nr:hypothetical protein M422DRAFT_273099 [Sphaerobolus stellatus SS14]KIJ43840.1 hypothetical protein M422DRAFT_252751 [Sphaerobolus stellatus SS14]
MSYCRVGEKLHRYRDEWELFFARSKYHHSRPPRTLCVYIGLRRLNYRLRCVLSFDDMFSTNNLIWLAKITCYYLLSKKSGFNQTNTVPLRLAKIPIKSALGPTILALATLILSDNSPEGSWFMLNGHYTLTHVYAASPFYTVNSRQNVTEDRSPRWVPSALRLRNPRVPAPLCYPIGRCDGHSHRDGYQ